MSIVSVGKSLVVVVAALNFRNVPMTTVVRRILPVLPRIDYARSFRAFDSFDSSTPALFPET